MSPTRHLLCAALAAVLASSPALADTIALNNAGFEAGWTGTSLVGSDGHVTFNYGPTGPQVGWSFGAGTGVAASYDAFTAYEGQRFALLQTHTGAIEQAFGVATESSVDLSFALALRPGYWAGQVVRVSVDGHAVADLAAGSTQWQLQHLSLGRLAAGQHSLAFAGLTDYAGYRDTTAYLDAVSLQAAPVPEPQGWALLAAGLLGLGWLQRRSRRHG